MNQSKYLIIGSSHAALEAAAAIRMQDETGTITLISRDPQRPYSPTVLPYVISGQSDPEQIRLRDDDYFARHNITLVLGDALLGLDCKANVAHFSSGQHWQYDKLLLATGSTPAIPPVTGLDEVPFHVVRTLDDALGLRQAMQHARRAVVLGGGFVGTHAAENLAKAGLEVTLVEMQAQLLPWYFDQRAAGLIEQAFSRNGISVLTQHRVDAVVRQEHGCRLTLSGPDGTALAQPLEADLLVVATGVKMVMDYLEGSPIETDMGIIVNDRMQTSQANVWAAGDVAQARCLLNNLPSPASNARGMINGILPDAVEQGRIAGMQMAGDSAAKTYSGGVPINTFSFFGNRAVSVGCSSAPVDDDSIETCLLETDAAGGEAHLAFRKVLLQNNRLIGISAINDPIDAGIMWQLILRGTDLGPVKEAFLAQPLATGRQLMSATWR